MSFKRDCCLQTNYTLQLNRKVQEGPQDPDRDGQFRYIHRQVQAFRRSGDPVLSVDGKKHELIGAFKNAGRRWRRKGRPKQVNAYDFPSAWRKAKGFPTALRRRSTRRQS